MNDRIAAAEGYEGVPTRLAFDDAIAIVRQVAASHRVEPESVAVARCHGRVLAADVVAPIALPPFDNSAMDGYAFRHADLAGQGPGGLQLAGEQFAGVVTGQGVGAGECIGITTGDDLVPPGLPLAPGQIHDSNRELLAGLLLAEGLEPTLWPALPDDPRRIEVALRDACCAFDVVLTCGGVSAGGKDHVPAVLAGFGTPHFWKVRMKPGMPVLFGSLDQARLLGLPGNPVSVLATWLTFGRALVDGLQGRTDPRPVWRARLAVPLSKPHPRREFQRARLEARDDGALWATPDPATGSHRLRAAAGADALLLVPEGPCDLPTGAVLDVLPLP